MRTPRTILVVDDDPKFRVTIQRGLADSDLVAHTAGCVAEALELIEDPGAGAFDLILLDVMMPGASGWELLERMRASGDQTPVIFLTARHEVEERVKGLRLGAEDYIVKPFAFSELLARIDVVFRRERQATEIHVGDLGIDLTRRRVERSGVLIELSPRELDLLQLLAGSPGRVFGRAELLEEVWGIDFNPGTNVVNVAIARLRRKLCVHGPPMIETVVGEGYRLLAPTQDTGTDGGQHV